MSRLRVAVVGAGQFGQNHIRVVKESAEAELAAVVDADLTRAGTHGVPAFASIAELSGIADCAIVSAPTALHRELGCALMEQGLDVLVEKPIAPDLVAADELCSIAQRTGRILQIGHLERFNPAVLALEKAVTAPLFFEIHRMSVFSPRSLDVDVVLDLMIHDLDIVLALTRAPLEEVRAAGVQILSAKADIANVRLQFTDGCVANLTASRVSTEKVRKLRLFQPSQYLSLDYARQDLAIFTVGAGGQIRFAQHEVAKAEPLKSQFAAFCESVRTRVRPKLDGATARRTLELALAITSKMESHADLVKSQLEAQ